MGKQTIAKAKRSKQSRSKLLIVTAAAILAVAFATRASAQQVSTVSVQTTTPSQYKAATGGITDIDAPATVYLTVSGWTLNASGIDRVDAYAWDAGGHAHSLGSVGGNKLTSRQDVKAAFPDYGTLNSGYTLTVNTTKLPAGNYALAVAWIGTDGSVQWATKNITNGDIPPIRLCSRI
ncbi:hypothetical protein [Ethanoligenens sp.]|uniref:hypothetical protein n=1 Tax=Ethanoligenens sp. TaxID=2099655 RepID=UPI0039EC4702